jgi:hypothetical protein
VADTSKETRSMHRIVVDRKEKRVFLLRRPISMLEKLRCGTSDSVERERRRISEKNIYALCGSRVRCRGIPVAGHQLLDERIGHCK